jgi:hypothetical protein
MICSFRKATTGSIVAALGVALASPAWADRLVDPDQLPPRAREFALHGPLGAYDPFGNPTNPGCNWSRIQVPSSQGLKWMALEECILNFTK